MGAAAASECHSFDRSPSAPADVGTSAELGVNVVSICVCTKGRREDFVRCLTSLLSQRLNVSNYLFRIIVVDNSVERDAFESVQALLEVNAQIVYVHEPRPGIPAARNAALNAAVDIQSNWIAFIDDDEVAPSRWLESLLGEAEQSQADVIHGTVHRSATRDEIDRLAANWRPDGQPSFIERTNKAATNNVIFRAWLAAAPVSLRFDENMRDRGGSDGEFFMRANDLGASIVRTSGALVFETWAAERETLTYSSLRAYRVGANCNYRYRKNRSWPLASALLVARSVERVGTGSARLVLAVCLLCVSQERARRMFRQSVLDFCFASGCLLPFIGLAPKTYR